MTWYFIELFVLQEAIAMNSMREMEKFVSNCLLTADSKITSMYEAETISVMTEAPSGDQTGLKAEKDFENQSAHDDKKQSRLHNSKGFSKEKQYNIPLQNQE